jgi:raffinose/stachyose/melibiose transport system permease protein
MSTLIYKNAFLFSDYGYSVALAVVLSIFAGVLSVLWYRYLNRKEK